MVAAASYETFPSISKAGLKASFLWTMLALAVLDLVLLFWILKPWSTPDQSARLASAHAPVVVEPMSLGVVAKPSPLGPIASVKAPARRAVSR